MTRDIIVLELFFLVAVWTVFIVVLSFTWIRGRLKVVRWWKGPNSLQIGLIAIVGIVEAGVLLAAGMNSAPPLWVYAMVFGAIDVVTVRWLYLVWKQRKHIDAV